jgi:thiol-disulfide isomerase/thioredoxin
LYHQAEKGFVTGLFLTALAIAGLLPVDDAGYPKLVAAQKGQVTLINFWATWCEPCREEMPALVKMESALRPKGFQLITISADEPEDEGAAAEFLSKNGVRPPAYIKRVKNDDRFITSIDSKWSGALPALFLYDRSGRKVRGYIGETDLKALEADIRKLL